MLYVLQDSAPREAMVLKTPPTATPALLVTLVAFWKKDPEFEKMTPKYVYRFTTSIRSSSYLKLLLYKDFNFWHSANG